MASKKEKRHYELLGHLRRAAQWRASSPDASVRHAHASDYHDMITMRGYGFTLDEVVAGLNTLVDYELFSVSMPPRGSRCFYHLTGTSPARRHRAL